MKIKQHARWKTGAMAALMVAALALAGCASVDKGAARKNIGSAESALARADTNDANRYAPLEVKVAQEKLAQANSAFANEEYKKAEYLAEESLVNAQLASSKSETARTETMVQALRESISSLRQEIERNDSMR